MTKIRAGKYRLDGVTCHGDKYYGPCGGQIYTERTDGNGEALSEEPEWRWETYCEKCKTCDPNGHPNLKTVLANVSFWRHA